VKSSRDLTENHTALENIHSFYFIASQNFTFLRHCECYFHLLLHCFTARRGAENWISSMYEERPFWGEFGSIYMEFGQYNKFPDNRRIGDLERTVELKYHPTVRFAGKISH
jgi:hypothetical protein